MGGGGGGGGGSRFNSNWKNGEVDVECNCYTDIRVPESWNLMYKWTTTRRNTHKTISFLQMEAILGKPQRAGLVNWIQKASRFELYGSKILNIYTVEIGSTHYPYDLN